MKLAVVISFVGSFALLAPGGAFAQHSANGAASVGTAVPAGSSSGGGGSSSSGGSTSSGGSGDGGQVSSTGGRHSSNPNRASNAVQSASHTQGVFTNYSQLAGAAPPFSRPRNGASIIGVAVPRTAAPATAVGGSEGLTFIYGTYNPWIYAYDGFAATAMYGIYDPFDADFGFPGGVRTVSTQSSSDDGVLRLDVKPWKADVYIDGDRAGSVDQFQGLLHKLRLPAGVHRVELRAPGHETLVVNVRIEPGETITYRGTLEKTAP